MDLAGIPAPALGNRGPGTEPEVKYL